ncbi:MAG TPA: SBBP repeat-containing protein, partial [Bacteroidia bacterium]|nr:SBBP repeat-containing protein [Bacteroidia bacterium]
MKNKNTNSVIHRRLFNTVFILLFSLSLNAQTPQAQVFQEWTSTAGAQSFFQKSVTKTDASSNVFIAGASLNSSGDYDIMVAKYSPDGYLYWYNQYAGGGNGNDFATALTIDGSGNVIITGSVVNDVLDSNDVVTIKYNSSGTQQWATSYHGGTGSDVGTDIVADASGNIFVSGATNQGSSTKFDALLLKYNSSGTQQWASLYNYNSLWDGGYRVVLLNGGKIGIAAIAQNSNTNYKLAVVKYNANGSFSSATVTGNSGIGFTMVYSCVVDNQHNMYVTGCTNGTSSVDYYTIKLDSALNQLWTATYNGASNLNDEAKGIVVDGSGNVYITGYCSTSSQGKDMVTIKYNSGGTQQWAKIYNGIGSGDDEAFAIAIDASGNPVVCGASNNGDSYDYYTVKYDPSANIKWQMTWNSAANRSDRAMDVAVDQNGAVIVTGQSMTSATTFTYVTIKYSEHAILTPTDSEPLLHAFCFTENRGQLLDTDNKEIPEVKFYNRENAGRQQLYFTDDRLSYVFARLDTSSTSPIDTLERIDMTFDNSNSDKLIYGMDKRTDYVNYFLGQFTDPFGRIANYDRLYHEEVYDGIDVMYASNSRGLKYYYLISPNASTSDLAEVYDGASNIYVDTNGDLVIEGQLGTIRRPQPKVWEVTSGGSTVSLTWQPSYNVTGNVVTLTLGAYTAGNTLVIQVDFGNAPTIQQNPNDNLDWATHYGSQAGNYDPIGDTETDLYGNSYFSGYTAANAFPVANGVQTSPGGNTDGTILKFDPGADRLWATYIGGPGAEATYHIDVDTAGNVYFGGRTTGGIFTTPLAGAYYDNSHNGGFDWHLGKILTNGSSLLWSTYYGAGGDDYFADMKVTPTADRLYYIGNTGSSAFPLCPKTGAYN